MIIDFNLKQAHAKYNYNLEDTIIKLENDIYIDINACIRQFKEKGYIKIISLIYKRAIEKQLMWKFKMGIII
jgi:hypothetical protein